MSISLAVILSFSARGNFLQACKNPVLPSSSLTLCTSGRSPVVFVTSRYPSRPALVSFCRRLSIFSISPKASARSPEIFSFHIHYCIWNFAVIKSCFFAWICIYIWPTRLRWPEMIPNEELWERTGQEQIITEIKRRKWGWIGHTLRKPATNTTRQALSWNPQGKRKVGRPRQTWRRSVEEELKAVGIRWSELGRTCQNRVRWRSIVTALCSP